MRTYDTEVRMNRDRKPEKEIDGLLPRKYPVSVVGSLFSLPRLLPLRKTKNLLEGNSEMTAGMDDTGSAA